MAGCRSTASIFALTLLVSASGAPVPRFEKVPAEALNVLSGVRGKPVRTGLVFVNGHYMNPPYTVSRMGTAIFVNREQVTGQVVPWRSFLATQGADALSAPLPPVSVPKPSPVAKKPETAAPAGNPAPATASIDDLFDDAPAGTSSAPPSSPAAPSASAPAAQSASSSLPSLKGEFDHNAQSEKLVKRVDAARFDVHRNLKAGNLCFYGSRYAAVTVPERLAKNLLEVLPEAMRDSSDAADLRGRLRQKGFAFLPLALCEDLMNNRADYMALQARRRKIGEDDALDKMLNGSRSGLGR